MERRSQLHVVGRHWIMWVSNLDRHFEDWPWAITVQLLPEEASILRYMSIRNPIHCSREHCCKFGFIRSEYPRRVRCARRVAWENYRHRFGSQHLRMSPSCHLEKVGYHPEQCFWHDKVLHSAVYCHRWACVAQQRRSKGQLWHQNIIFNSAQSSSTISMGWSYVVCHLSVWSIPSD